MNKIKYVFDVLYKYYGPQYWWPVIDNDIPEYKPRKNITEKQKLEIMFGAILTQNTSWSNVEKAIINLNKHDLINIDKIISIEHEVLANLIKSSGYYNQKAIKLKELCKFLKKYSITALQKMQLDEMRNKLLTVKGIGKETADSIILYALNKSVFVIDAYTKRLFSRIGITNENISYDELQLLFQNNILPDAQIFNEYHALIVKHSKEICKKLPECNSCILRTNCNYNKKIS